MPVGKGESRSRRDEMTDGAAELPPFAMVFFSFFTAFSCIQDGRKSYTLSYFFEKHKKKIHFYILFKKNMIYLPPK